MHISVASLVPLVATTINFGQASVLHRSTDSIKWFSCQQNATVPYTCGTLTVPLDYSDPSSSKTLDLALAKVAATKQPKKGSILFNPGGPGSSGRNMLTGDMVRDLSIVTGGYHDLILFDPRGTGDTIPFYCYTNDGDRKLADAYDTRWTNASDTAVGQYWAFSAAKAEYCYENNKDTGNLLGTAYVARDMMQIVDALNEDGLLRYWGFSYGTVLGATVAAMFPDRMDKVVLDGVVNPHSYYSGIDLEAPQDTDKVSAGFFEGCAANPKLCPLASPDVTADSLSQQFNDFLQDLKYNPVTLDLINYRNVRDLYFSRLYSPSTWPVLAKLMSSLLSSNYTAALDTLQELMSPELFQSPPPQEALSGIQCGDSAQRAEKLADVQPLVDEYKKTSQVAGERLVAYGLMCLQWQFEAKERYTGGFNVSTKNPLLIASNKFDPVTPLASAQNVTATFEGSVLIQNSGYGHTTSAQPSLCIVNAIQAYFLDGILPAPNTICDPSVPTFTTKTNSSEIFSSIAKRSLKIKRTDDEKLLDAVAGIHKTFMRAH